MLTKVNIHTEVLKTSKLFPEIYFPIKSYKIHKNLNINHSKKNIKKKIEFLKRHKKRFSPDIKKLKKINSNDNNNISQENNCKQNHKSSQSTNNFNGKSLFYKNSYNKSQDKPIKKNIVSQKFKIADDFNEKNSNQFLNEKDECLREVFLSDKIEEDEFIHFCTKNEKRNISNIKKNKINDDFNIKQVKRKIAETKLIENH